MADPTPVAMRLAEVSLDASLNEHVLEIDEDGKVTRPDQLVIAHALDDAGVREAVEKLEWVVRDSYYKAPEQLDPLHKAWLGKVESALSTLTGTAQEKNDE